MVTNITVRPPQGEHARACGKVSEGRRQDLYDKASLPTKDITSYHEVSTTLRTICAGKVSSTKTMNYICKGRDSATVHLGAERPATSICL